MAQRIGGFTHTFLSLSVLALLSACGGPPVTQNALPSGNSGPPSGTTPTPGPTNPGTNNPTTPLPPDAPNLIGDPATATANPAVLTTTRTTVYNLNSPALGAGGWQDTALLETDPQSARNPQVAFDRSGNGFVVWAQGGDMIARRYDAASASWGNPVVLDSSPQPVNQARVAVDRVSGNAIAVWTQSDGVDNSLYSSRFNTLTNTWSSAELIETAAGAVDIFDENSSVAISGGHAAVAWLQNDGPSLNVYLSRLVSGSWTTPELVETAAEPAQQPKVAIDSNGNVTVAWRQLDSLTGNRNINIRRWDNTAAAFGPVTAMNNIGDRHPRLQFDAGGNGFLLWRGGGGAPFTRRYDVATDSWSSQLSLPNPGATTDAGDISVDEAGNAMVVWIELDGGNSYIYSRRYNAAAASWGDAELLETTTNVVSLIVSMSGDDAIVSWLHLNAANREDVYSIKQTDGVWGTTRLLETRSGSGAELTSTINAAGNAAVVWTQSDDSSVSIWEARHLSANLVITAGDTWQSLANTLYGVNAVEAGLALQAAMGGVTLSEGMILSGFPATLTVTVSVPAFYTVLSTDTWAHVANTVYGVTDAAAIAQLRAALGNPTLAAGLQLVVPSSFGYITSANFSAPVDWSRVNTTATEYYPIDSSLLTVPLNDWSAAQALENSNDVARHPRVAFDEAGNGIVVWAQGSDVIVRRYLANSGWSTPTVLDTNPNVPSLPRVSIDRATGDAIVSWIQSDGAAPSMYVSSFDASTNTWSMAQLLETSNEPLNTIWSPAVSRRGEHGVVTWLQAEAGVDHVYMSRLMAGTWTPAVRIDTGTGLCMQIEAAVDANGNVTASWRQLEAGNGYLINTRRWDNTALAYSPVMRMSVAGDRQAKLGFDTDGDAVLLWRGGGIHVREFDVTTGQWSSQRALHTTNDPAMSAGLAELSVSPSGDALAAWPETFGGVSTMYASYYDASTGTWSAATTIANDVRNVVKITVSMVGETGVVGWVSDVGADEHNVYAARLQSGVWGAASMLETSTGRSIDVSAAVNAESNATVIWEQYDEAAPSIYQANSNSTPYFIVPAGATWRSLAATLYAVDSDEAGEALALAMGEPTLTTGMRLDAPPTTLVLTPDVPTFYIVQSGDTWQSITLALYGTDRSEAATALWNYVGRPTLTVGQSLAIPSQLADTIIEE